MNQTVFDQSKMQIESALETGEYLVASNLSAKLLASYPQVAESHYLNARVKAENGDRSSLQEAVISAERAVMLEPNSYRYNYYCGSLYLEFDLYELALPLLRRSVQQQPNAAKSQLELADCYFEIDKGELAIPYFRAALKLEENGDRRDMIRSKLAHCLVTSGRPQEALLLLNRLIKDNSLYYVTALCEKISIANDEINSVSAKRVKAALVQNNLAPEHREILHLALGQVYENSKDFENAFAQWIASREIAKAIAYNLREHEVELVRYRAFYTAALYEKVAPYVDQTEVPVFIAGMPRSGTTLTEQIIAAHSQATGVGELARWNKIEDHFRRGYVGEDAVEKILENAKLGQLKHLAKELLHIFHVVADQNKLRIVEKTPHNFYTLGYLHLICPRAKFIHIRRNPADTFISAYRNRFSRSHGYAYDQIEYVKEYLWHEQMMDLWRSLFPELILTINYEQLVAEPEHVAKKIFEHIDLPWEEQTLRFFESKKTVRTFSTHQVRNPINTKSVDRWRRYEKHLGPLLNWLEEAKFEYKYIPV